MGVKKNQKLKDFEDYTTGICVPLYLNPNTYRFVATFNDQQFEADTMDALEEKVQEAITASITIQWVPAIEIIHYQPAVAAYQGEVAAPSFVGFKHRRFWLGLRSDNTALQAGWETTEEERQARHQTYWMGDNRSWPPKFPITAVRSHLQEYTLLAYRETLWDALNILATRVMEARERLDTLLKTPEGHARMEEALAGMLALPAPETPRLLET